MFLVFHTTKILITIVVCKKNIIFIDIYMFLVFPHYKNTNNNNCMQEKHYIYTLWIKGGKNQINYENKETI
jgi:hypothetical protein